MHMYSIIIITITIILLRCRFTCAEVHSCRSASGQEAPEQDEPRPSDAEEGEEECDVTRADEERRRKVGHTAPAVALAHVV